ncbi:Protein CBR-IFFB-1 [Caenorhabditis briggsae]|uniref:Eukaryotic translation initiation factor 5B n=2 Tax=Caenorhabditis briggsae TaxID=6238 RepID=A8XMH8_CAEBR|nr:Protein CBR-IFFB-1 [Caenorhabditis briggsae]ULT98665.1 hypothetical protein L3Y34_000201 [Caenorhabditis briggsae]CAP33854.1 Protein CBR-IFFB-1 [Caenorhabditis briggsae]
MPPKKGGKKNKDDDWDDDAAEKKLAALNIGGASETNWDDEEPKKAKAKAKAPAKKGFAAFLDEDSEPEQKPSDDDEPAPVVKEVKEAIPAPKKEKKEKKKGGKKGKKEEDDEDLDALLASIENAPAAAEVAAEEEGKNKKDKKKKKEKAPEPAEEPKKSTSETPEPSPEAPESSEKAEPTEEGGDDKEKEKKDKKKDKKKQKEKEKKEKEKEDKKGQKKGTLSLIKEMLKKQQEEREEQERLQKEQQEREAQEELERQEREKAEKERKEAQKEAKKAEIERQKAAGTYVTAAQKRQQALALEKLRAAGYTVPAPRDSTEEEGAPKKSFVYVDEKTKAKQEEKKRRRLEKLGQLPVEKQEEEKVEKAEEAPESPEAVTPEQEKKELTPEPLDDWEMADSGDEVAEKGEEKKKPEKKAGAAVVKESVDEEESSDEESDEETSEEEESSEEEEEEDNRGQRETKEQIMERVKARIARRKELAASKRSTDDLRSPVICVLGHVDTGKTKMLDTIRRTNVQQGEAGGITQQIGATEVPAEAIKERCRQVRGFLQDQMKIPGFLIIDTPGHESFSNLRTRGSSLCDFAILVVDIMHGLEPQTIESLKLLIKGKTPFVIALNKIDRLYEYESNPRKDVYELLKSQKPRVQAEFKERMDKIIVEFAEQELNVTLSNNTKKAEDSDYVCMVPTSAMLGDGIGNLMAFIVNQTQTKYAQKLAFSEELDATVMEVKQIAGLGTTIDVILVNGTMRAGDVLVLTGTDGAIVTQVRELLMPKPLKELRVKNDYIHYKEVKGARGVKVLAKNLEKVLAGLPVYITDREDEVDYLRQEADNQLANALHAIKKKPEGVYVQASTLGSLEALLDFLKSQKIPYSNVNIGPVHKKDVQKASAMKEHKAEYACILAFDVKVEREAQIFADHEGVKVFQADIIYHLQDAFLKYREELKDKARKENEHLAIFPCKLRVLPNHVYNTRAPIIFGVSIEAGQVKRGTPICVPSKEGILLGTISSVQRNNEEVPLGKQGEEVCIKIENTTGEAPRLYGRHFTHEDPLVSKITRESIDVCKTYFRDDLTKADWQLVVQLKKMLDIM